jgi:hypothetical protein
MEPPHDSYGWNKAGEPDPELRRWEELLSGFSGKAESRPLPLLPIRRSARSIRVPWFGRIAATVCVLIAASAIILRIAWQPGADWKVTTLSGAPTINNRPLEVTGRLSTGEILKTDNRSRAMLRMGLMGKIEVGPDTNIRLFSTRSGHHRFSLQGGKITARIWAPPFTLFVETPSATAIDLGCAFTLQVAPRGSGELRVQSGWVEFELNDRQAIVPAGAMVFTQTPVGPGTPFFEDASNEFRIALQRLDFGKSGYQDTDALRVVLAEARQRDAITLLTLLRRVQPNLRAAVFDRAATLVPPPSDLTREDVVRGTNQHGIDDWWKELGLGEAKRWILNWRDAITP